MDKYLLDTNAFFELLSYMSGKNVRKDEYHFEDIKNGQCYISKITELEIISVVGKYGRGETPQWQKCNRIVSEKGIMCDHRYFHKGKRPWNKKLCRDVLKLVKEILGGNNPILKVTVLGLNEKIIDRAEIFMMHSSKYKFGSQDALIAATALAYAGSGLELQVVTSDRALCAAMREEGMSYIVPGNRMIVE